VSDLSLPILVTWVLGFSLVALAIGLAFLTIRYVPLIVRIFEEQPLFLPLRLAPRDGGESVRFPTEDGLMLAGSYFPARTAERAGVLVFCHEFLSDRWSFDPYTDSLRDLGFDVFAFDFRNHGESDSDPRYSPLQWATDHEVRDLRAALDYLRSRPDHDRSGFGLFGVSRGGSAALLVSAEAADVWGVVTDGAFPTRGTMIAYIRRWEEIYVRDSWIRALIPNIALDYLAWVTRLVCQRRLNCRFPDVETAVSRIAPRPWLAIHGEKDAYIGKNIIETLLTRAGEPKEFWLVPEAKHNRCREREPEAYSARLLDFLDRFAPRRPQIAAEPQANLAAVQGLEEVESELESSIPSRTSSPLTTRFETTIRISMAAQPGEVHSSVSS
jgi:pimeloyl-ACP methyl ester carboxylesterase